MCRSMDSGEHIVHNEILVIMMGGEHASGQQWWIGWVGGATGWGGAGGGEWEVWCGGNGWYGDGKVR